jgi:hypothetical protein
MMKSGDRLTYMRRVAFIKESITEQRAGAQ